MVRNGTSKLTRAATAVMRIADEKVNQVNQRRSLVTTGKTKDKVNAHRLGTTDELFLSEWAIDQATTPSLARGHRQWGCYGSNPLTCNGAMLNRVIVGRKLLCQC